MRHVFLNLKHGCILENLSPERTKNNQSSTDCTEKPVATGFWNGTCIGLAELYDAKLQVGQTKDLAPSFGKIVSISLRLFYGVKELLMADLNLQVSFSKRQSITNKL